MISICIITRNEAEKLKKCLEAIRKNCDTEQVEIVVVDTGSTDDSIAVAKTFTEQVYTFSWCNDFSAARNFCIDRASGEYILSLDTDEYITSMDWEKLQQLCHQYPKAVGRLNIRNLTGSGNEAGLSSEKVNRFFSKEMYCFTGTIHEQVTARLTHMDDLERTDETVAGNEEFSTYDLPITVDHDGYQGTPQQLQEKAKRNINLLKSRLERARDPYILYQTGKSYYMIHDYDKACMYFEEATTFDLDPRLEYVRDLINSYGYTLLNTRQYEKALFFENIYQEFGKSADFQFLMGLIYMNNARFEDAIQEFEKATCHEECVIEGVNSYKAFYNIGVIYECLGKTQEALFNYRKCGSYALTKKRIEALKNGM